jgi:DEAD/DEAH box helicase domain-containing protein
MRGLVSEFLLSDLASRGFLPGYGFQTDVVSFDNILFDADTRTGAQSPVGEDSPERRLQLRGTPSRQLDLAIRDYAPGNDVVVDGRVYRSAGIKLAWKRPVTEEGFENIRTMGWAWRCKSCGAIGSSHAQPANCSSCGAKKLIEHRYLKPTGFSCDPREKPHDKVEDVVFVPRQTPWVAAQRGEWVKFAAEGLAKHI